MIQIPERRRFIPLSNVFQIGLEKLESLELSPDQVLPQKNLTQVLTEKAQIYLNGGHLPIIIGSDESLVSTSEMYRTETNTIALLDPMVFAGRVATRSLGIQRLVCSAVAQQIRTEANNIVDYRTDDPEIRAHARAYLPRTEKILEASRLFMSELGLTDANVFYSLWPESNFISESSSYMESLVNGQNQEP